MSKLLVTRRSWQAERRWAKLPFFNGVRKSCNQPDIDVSPVAWIGDIVDSSVMLRDELCSVLPSQDQTVHSSNYPHLDPTDQQVMEEFLRVYGFRPYQIVFFCLSVLTYISDVGSDAYLVYSYYKQGDYIWSGLTLVLMLIPAVITTSFSLVWYVLDQKVHVDPPRTCRAWTLRLFFHGLQLAPLVRLTDAVYYGLASRRADVSLAVAVHYTQLMLYEDADSGMLRIIEGFMEAAPQLLLQLYIIFTQERHKQTFQIIAQAVSCCTSWLSLAWCLTHYQCALRSSRVEKAKLRWSGSILYFGWKAGMLASRLLSLALFAAVVQGLSFGLVLAMHWLISVIWLVAHGTTFCSPTPGTLTEYLFDAVLAAVYCFDVVNVREGHSRLRYVFWYTLIGLENLLMALTWSYLSTNSIEHLVDETHLLRRWFLRSNPLSPWVHDLPTWVLPICVIASFALGIFLMILYYIYVHPSRNIRIWIPLSELIHVTDRKLSNTAPPSLISSPPFVPGKCDSAIQPDSNTDNPNQPCDS